MSGRINKRFHGPALVSNAAATAYTVPANRRATITHIHAQNPSAAAVKLTASIGADAAATRIFDGFSIPAAGAGVKDNVLDHYCEYVLEAAEIIQKFADTNNILTLTIDGYEEVLA